MGVDFEQRVDFGYSVTTACPVRAPRWTPPSSARCSCSTSTTSATSPRR
ncbi:hypothetical protein ACFQX6_05455 [Streptosporangium lutulentum]